MDTEVGILDEPMLVDQVLVLHTGWGEDCGLTDVRVPQKLRKNLTRMCVEENPSRSFGRDLQRKPGTKHAFFLTIRHKTEESQVKDEGIGSCSPFSPVHRGSRTLKF